MCGVQKQLLHPDFHKKQKLVFPFSLVLLVSCLLWSCLVHGCLVMSDRVCKMLCCLGLSCPVLSCLVFSGVVPLSNLYYDTHKGQRVNKKEAVRFNNPRHPTTDLGTVSIVVFSCFVLSCLVLCCLVLSCLVLSNPVFFFMFQYRIFCLFVIRIS